MLKFEALEIPGLPELRIIANKFQPRIYPTRWQLFRWKYWDSESSKPQSMETMYLLSNNVVVSVEMYRILAASNIGAIVTNVEVNADDNQRERANVD